MPLLSSNEVLNLKVRSLPAPDLRALAQQMGLARAGNASQVALRILNSNPDESTLDAFIRERFAETVAARRAIISDDDLKEELMQVAEFSWGIVQGQLDSKIQAEYVRRCVRYRDLIQGVANTLHDELTNYVVCSWFNHWTTVLIEEHISTHPRVIPTVKNIKGVDIFFDGQPFDLKVTYLPRGYSSEAAITNPSGLAVWMYENQGAQRFGDENRIFVVLIDEDDRERSWELKRDFALVFDRIDQFFNEEYVSAADEVFFSFGQRTYTTVSKVLIIGKSREGRP